MTLENRIICGDSLGFMKSEPAKKYNLVMGSPPYENARSYSIGFNLRGDAWVQWMVEYTLEALRVCNGLVAFVVEGRTSKFAYTATPLLLMAELHKRGVTLRKPPIFQRVGIPGSGGPDWLRNDYEFIVCATNGGKLPWSDNTVMGHPPKWAPGGEMSHRLSDGTRRNQWGATERTGGERRPNGTRQTAKRPSHTFVTKSTARRYKDGDLNHEKNYKPPKNANPGNVIKCNVGGGQMGSQLAHLNEAPYPESLVEFFVRSFCPPGGIVLDPFSGSGTTAAVAQKTGRRYVGVDIRKSQVKLANRRLAEDRTTAELNAVIERANALGNPQEVSA